METRRIRLGDVIDDYCSRCRLLMNHGVVSMVGDDVKKVRCNTCMWEHAYRRGKLPASKRNATNKLFDEVLRGIAKPERPVPAALPAREATESREERDGRGEPERREEPGSREEPGGREEPGSASDARADRARPDDDGAPAEPEAGSAPPEPGVSESGAALGADRTDPAPPPEPARAQRKLYTIRRAINDKSVDRGPKKS